VGEASVQQPPFDRQTWRARRLERREKQRQESVARAEQMHAARIATGPAAPAPAELADPSTLLIGCSGWFYWHWKGRFYPAASSSSDWFAQYARTFRTVELNAPFYCWPKISTVQGWLRQAGRHRFTYTVKASDLITHVKRFSRTARLVRDFYHIGDLLGRRMGCFLFQLPPSFRYSRARLDRIVRQLDPTRRNVVEFRHKSWWNPAVYAAFRKAGIIFCSCSGPRLPDELVKTAEEVYVRFHGTSRWYRHDYSDEELAAWAARIRDSGATRVWAYFNNDRECYAIKNALELIRQLKRKARPPRQRTAAGAAPAATHIGSRATFGAARARRK
jgi:uncharacterized protein YecE (DUF72 family)